MSTYAWGIVAYAMLLTCFGVFLWWDARRYPVCGACGSNAHVVRDARASQCTVHGMFTEQHDGDRPCE